MIQSLARRDTLRRRADFELLRVQGQRTHGSFLSLNWAVGLFDQQFFAIIVPKHIGNAVARNRVKRRVREIYRLMRGTLPQTLTSIWIAKKSASTATYLQLKADMEKVYRKISQ